MALLIDAESGQIVNAAECKIGETSAVENITDGARRVTGRYDAMGNRVGENYRGITIITYSDGTVAKVMNK